MSVCLSVYSGALLVTIIYNAFEVTVKDLHASPSPLFLAIDILW